MNNQLDILIKKAIELLNNKKQIKEVIKQYNYTKSSVEIGNYKLEISIEKGGNDE